MQIICSWMRAGEPIKKCLEDYVAPLVDLALRLYMAHAFYKSGILKLDDLWNDNWAHTVALFRDVTPVPFLSAELAAPMGMVGELLFSVLLALGLFGRLGALGIVGMSALISFSFWYFNPDDFIQYYDEQLRWILLTLPILVRGPGTLSIDYLIAKKCGMRG